MKVEIHSPSGVKASASGDGLLKDTQIEQRVQMQPASSARNTSWIDAYRIPHH